MRQQHMEKEHELENLAERLARLEDAMVFLLRTKEIEDRKGGVHWECLQETQELLQTFGWTYPQS